MDPTIAVGGDPITSDRMRLADMTINFYFFFKIQGEKNKRHKRHTRLNPLCHKAFRVWRLLYPNATHATKTPHTGPNATLVLRDIVATPLPQCLLAGIRPTSASTWRDSPAAAKDSVPLTRPDSVPLTRPEVCSPVEPGPRHFSRSRTSDRVLIKHRDPVDGIPVVTAMVVADARRRGGLLVLA